MEPSSGDARGSARAQRSRHQSLLAVLLFTVCLTVQPFVFKSLWPYDHSLGGFLQMMGAYAELFYGLLLGLLLSLAFYILSVTRSFRERKMQSLSGSSAPNALESPAE